MPASITDAADVFFKTGAVDGYVITKFLLQRGLALVYVMAFTAAFLQFRPLLGEHGLLPVPQFLKYSTFAEYPSLFRFLPYDRAFAFFAAVGIAVSGLALFGVTERFGGAVSIVAWLLLWVLYLSFVNVGQTFYGFGWESMLLEAGLLGAFLGPAGTKPPFLVILLFRWLLFRTMFGAGMIKLRGDECWKDLTCLFRHFETQPMPNPLSWYFHWLPRPFLRFGVLFNHFVELVLPFTYFLTQPLAAIAGLITLSFHAMLFVSGNFAWLNFMTLVLSFSLIGDKVWALVPGLAALAGGVAVAPSAGLGVAVLWLFAISAVLSVFPIANLASPGQAMNVDYNPLHLVGSYGAFGSVTEKQWVVDVQGTDAGPDAPDDAWKSYRFWGRPGELDRMPGQFAPYHLRLDWLMWFAGFTPARFEPWFPNFLAKLLLGDKATLALLREDPFASKPPIYVRAMLYEYRFTTPEERRATGNWWARTLVGPYFPAMNLPEARAALPAWAFK